MVQSCSAFGCPSKSVRGCNIKFHRFPKDPVLQRKWVNATKIKNFQPSKTSVLCGKHFCENNYRESVMGTKVLKKDAVPSLFNFDQLAHTSTQQVTIKPRRVLIRERQNEEETCLNNSNQNNDELKQPDLCSPTQSDTTSMQGEFIQNAGDKEVLVKTQSVIEVKIKRKRSRVEPVHLGDFTEEDLECPIKRKRYWSHTQEKLKVLTKKNKILQARLKRRESKIASMNSLVDRLRKQNYLT